MATGTNRVTVPWDATVVFRNNDIPLYIYMLDVLEVMTGSQELNILVIQLCFM